MKNCSFNLDLEDILFKYERLTAQISIMQAYLSECVDTVGAPKNAVSYAIYEIEAGMRETTEKLTELLSNARGGGKNV